MNTKGIFSHASDNWRTPKDIYDCFIEHGFIDCFKYEANYDEFKNSYRGGRLFVNPPYSKLDQVVDWVIEQARNENHIFLLIPVRTDTKYFNKLINKLGFKINIIFITGRLKFNESKNSAPFPSMFIEISEKPREIKDRQTFYVCTKDEFIGLLEQYY